MDRPHLAADHLAIRRVAEANGNVGLPFGDADEAGIGDDDQFDICQCRSDAAKIGDQKGIGKSAWYRNAHRSSWKILPFAQAGDGGAGRVHLHGVDMGCLAQGGQSIARWTPLK